MHVYDIQTPHNYSQKSCVVADDMGEAETLFLEEYPNTTILAINLHADYVIVKGLQKE